MKGKPRELRFLDLEKLISLRSEIHRKVLEMKIEQSKVDDRIRELEGQRMAQRPIENRR